MPPSVEHLASRSQPLLESEASGSAHVLSESEPRASRGKAFRAIYQELVDTEESYLASLHTVLDLFMGPMEQSNAVPRRDFR